MKKNETTAIPRFGDLYYAELSRQEHGHGQSGVRPVVVVQNNKGNKFCPFTWVVPFTSRTDKGRHLSTHIDVPAGQGLRVDSVALVEQLVAIDKSKLMQRIGTLDQHYIQQIGEAFNRNCPMYRGFDNEAA